MLWWNSSGDPHMGISRTFPFSFLGCLDSWGKVGSICFLSGVFTLAQAWPGTHDPPISASLVWGLLMCPTSGTLSFVMLGIYQDS